MCGAPARRVHYNVQNQPGALMLATRLHALRVMRFWSLFVLLITIIPVSVPLVVLLKDFLTKPNSKETHGFLSSEFTWEHRWWWWWWWNSVYVNMDVVTQRLWRFALCAPNFKKTLFVFKKMEVVREKLAVYGSSLVFCSLGPCE